MKKIFVISIACFFLLGSLASHLQIYAGDMADEVEEQTVVSSETETSSEESPNIYIPQDPWNDPQGNNTPKWAPGDLSGTNWWVQAVQLPEAWYYKDHFQEIKVGVVDGGFYTDHEDLDITVLNPEQNEKANKGHGTAVAAVIGANWDNEKGITGVMNQVDLYGYATGEGENINGSLIFEGINACLEQGCRVINLSLNKKTTKFDENEINGFIKYLIELRLLYGPNFIIVESAGNKKEKDSAFFADEASEFSYFAVTPAQVEKMLQSLSQDPGFLEKYPEVVNLSPTDVTDCVLIAGGVTRTAEADNYSMAWGSNYGSEVSVCAPYNEVLTAKSVSGGVSKYAYKDGTSFSSPIVAGIVGLVWSINPDMTNTEVAQIITYTATSNIVDPNLWNEAVPAIWKELLITMGFDISGAMEEIYKIYNLETEESDIYSISGYYMVNAKAAVELAIQKNESNASETAVLPYAIDITDPEDIPEEPQITDIDPQPATEESRDLQQLLVDHYWITTVNIDWGSFYEFFPDGTYTSYEYGTEYFFNHSSVFDETYVYTPESEYLLHTYHGTYELNGEELILRTTVLFNGEEVPSEISYLFHDEGDPYAVRDFWAYRGNTYFYRNDPSIEDMEVSSITLLGCLAAKGNSVVDTSAADTSAADNYETASTESPYAEIVRQYEAEHGKLEFHADNYGGSFYTGVFLIKLLDFDLDGVDELVIGYASRFVDPQFGETDFSIPAMDVWTLENGIPVKVYEGAQLVTGSVNRECAYIYWDDRYCLVTGWVGSEPHMVIQAFENGSFQEIFDLQEEYTGTYYQWIVNGTVMSEEQGIEIYRNIDDNSVTYYGSIQTQYGDSEEAIRADLNVGYEQLGMIESWW